MKKQVNDNQDYGDCLKICQHIFCPGSVKYKPILIKIVLEETLNNTVQEVSTLPKICANTTLRNLR